jgi:gliding motility-associated-like protein
MVRGSDLDIRKILLSLLLLSGVSHSLFSQGTSIGGIVNGYMHVTAVNVPDNVTVSDASMFSAGDTVLLIQMKGAIINVAESGSYGGYRESTGKPGAYEFLIVQSVNTGTDNIVFTSNITNTYDIAGNVQLISVPFYNSATINSGMTCTPWDSVSKTGGVVSFIVGGNLSMNAGIDVTGKGFIGGTPFVGTGICTVTDQLTYDKFSYPDSYQNSGYKGEGLAIRAYVGPGDEPSVFPSYAKGKGSNFTSGGGGNGRFAGGGGGAGYGAGGTGGVEISTCGAGNQFGNGIGGKQIRFTDLEGGILLGSGGGASTYFTGATATAGGRGGGIVIIVCDTLIGKGNTIAADGGTPTGAASGNAGAGGGGGGGSVAIYVQGFSEQVSLSALTIAARGGDGGNANNQFGEGGGGGGGFISTNNPSFPANVVRYVTQGAVGTRTGGSLGGTSGQVGIISSTFTPLLNGFLYNSIKSSVSHNKIDSVCSNMRPPKILGTKPVGGSGSYTYIWQKSYESTFASPVTLTNDADPVNYTPTLADAVTPTDTVWFRRIIVDAGPPAITDISKAVKIVVHPAISNNRVGNPDTVCYNGNPPLIQQLMPDLVVPTTKYLFYEWQDSSSSGSWGAVRGTSKTYDPPSGLKVTTWYRRKVTSGSCVDSSAKVRMTALPVISNNLILNTPPDICYGMTFQNLTGSTAASVPALSGGDNTYRFRWISNINGSGWATAAGTNTQSGYDPVEQAQRVPSNEYYFRRIVYSGNNDVCFDTSAVVHLRDFPVITNNTLGPSLTQTVCSGSAPVKITGTVPSNGNGVFTYTWQDSVNSSSQWQNIPGYVNITNTDYQPPALSATTSFRRIALSSACSDISNAVKVTVDPPIVNNNVYLSYNGGSSDTTICNGQTHARLAGTSVTSGIYQWLYSSGSGSLLPVSGATQASYLNPPALNITTVYRRQVTRGVCVDTSNTGVTINVLPPVSNNTISADQSSVCENTAPDLINGTVAAGGSGSYIYLWQQSTDGGGSWTAAIGNNSLASYQPPALISGILYRRYITSGPAGCCSNISPAVSFTINPAPKSTVNAGPDAAIFAMDRTYVMNADPPSVTGETGSWTALDPGTAIIDNVSDNRTQVRNLSRGQNVFVWAVSNGLCSLEDTVIIELMRDFIPQGFSPNGDAWNNKFIIEGLNLDTETAELQILNGAGTVVYTTSNRNEQVWADWDGRNDRGNELPEGTYYYLFKVITQTNQTIKKSGFVVLKRY